MMSGRLSLADPGQGCALVLAANWVRALITGTPATIIATLAVASIGFLMLRGRLPLRRGLTVVLGCFVVFGASTIADGLVRISDTVSDREEGMPLSDIAVAPVLPPSVAPPQPQVYDPYAGASVPVR